MSEATVYSISTDEELYHGTFLTVEGACHAGATEVGIGGTFWVGEQVKPPQPEDLWDAAEWLEHVSVQDDYSGEHAEDWDYSTAEQRKQLEADVRAVLGKWLDTHDLRPGFWNIEKPRKFYVAGRVGDVFEIEAVS